jgi:2-polyprenyl-3-methyl-5-hydroxy-6-metoxy-1,4-benzoquinol methylase
MLDYDTKAPDYFQQARHDMLPFVPAHCHRVLDVGCAEGAFGDVLKKTRQIEVWGIEPTGPAAAKAKSRLDKVIEAPFDHDADLPPGIFDCIFFNDVLEHMPAPERALRCARTLLSPSGVIVASIPNVRSFPTIWQLMIHASWDYTDWGVLDRTHLRFFTRSSIVKMFQSEGYVLEDIRGINAYCGNPSIGKFLWRTYRIANAMSLGVIADMKFQQFAVVAKPAVVS